MIFLFYLKKDDEIKIKIKACEIHVKMPFFGAVVSEKRGGPSQGLPYIYMKGREPSENIAHAPHCQLYLCFPTVVVGPLFPFPWPVFSMSENDFFSENNIAFYFP